MESKFSSFVAHFKKIYLTLSTSRIINSFQKLVLFEGSNEVPEHLKKALTEGYDLLENFLKKSKYVAGDELSIADFSIVTTVNSFSAFVPLDESQYPHISSWMQTMEKLPYYDGANKEGMEMFRGMVAMKLSQ